MRAGFGIVLLTALLALGLGPRPAEGGEAYKYTDDQGRVHFTDNLSTVPRAYRRQVEELELAPRPARREADQSASNSWTSFGDRRSEAGFQPDMAALQDWLNRWGRAFVALGLLSGLVMIGTVYHALAHRRLLWALGNFFLWWLVVPFYVLLRLEEVGIPARVGLAVLSVSPIVVGALALRAALPILTG